MSKLWIERRDGGDRTVLRLAGHLGPGHLPMLERELAALPSSCGAGGSDALDLDLDLAGLTFLGCSAARRLNRLAEAGARLLDPPALIAEILEDDRCGP